MKSSSLTKSEYELLAEWRYSLRQFLHFSEEASRAAGITPQKHQALLAIKGFPDRDSVTVGELAERLQIRHHSAVGLINRLVAESLLERSPGARDRREIYVRLTVRGENVLEQLSIMHREQLRRIGPRINDLLRRLRGEGI